MKSPSPPGYDPKVPTREPILSKISEAGESPKPLQISPTKPSVQKRKSALSRTKSVLPSLGKPPPAPKVSQVKILDLDNTVTPSPAVASESPSSKFNEYGIPILGSRPISGHTGTAVKVTDQGPGSTPVPETGTTPTPPSHRPTRRVRASRNAGLDKEKRERLRPAAEDSRGSDTPRSSTSQEEHSQSDNRTSNDGAAEKSPSFSSFQKPEADTVGPLREYSATLGQDSRARRTAPLAGSERQINGSSGAIYADYILSSPPLFAESFVRLSFIK